MENFDESKLNRKDFLKGSGAGALMLFATEPLFALLRPTETAGNPLDTYPDRGWEKLYRDLVATDGEFCFLCAPNDTHNCLLKAHTKNGVAMYFGPSYGYGKAKDIYGNQSSHRWDPRLCQKGLALIRKVYGPRRVKYPMVRIGWKKWADLGFPRDADGRMPEEFRARGKEPFVKVSWDEAYKYAATSLDKTARFYDGEAGKERLLRQGYDPDMVDSMKGAGVQTLKFRGGMPLLGATRIFGMNRFTNMLALLDRKIRGVGPDKAQGGRIWDSYSWHTDLPPGHTMACGHQTNDFDLATAENAGLIVCIGMNWISTKMPDAHWLTEARLHGAKIVTVAPEYQSTSNKADKVIIARPGTDAALALGMVNVIIREKLYDAAYVRSHTDLPLLVRTDTLKHLKPSDFIPGYKNATLKRTVVLPKGEKPPSAYLQDDQIVSEDLREEWGDFTAWDASAGKPVVVTRDDAAKAGDYALEGRFKVTLLDGKTVEVRPVFDMVTEQACHYTPEATGAICHTAPDNVVWLAREIAKNSGRTLVLYGMGGNHFFNNVMKDRTGFLLVALTRNIGTHSGNIGSYSGNYRGAYFNGLQYYIGEDPFHIALGEKDHVSYKSYYHYESAHYYNYGDRPLRVGNKNFTGQTHMPSPTKFMWFSNGNSILGNIKWHHDVVMNTLPKIETICVSEWWWTASCEYADIVFPVDSWAEVKMPDMTAAISNPFVQMFPKTPLKRLHDSQPDIAVLAGVAKALADITGEKGFIDYWKWVHEDRVEVYLQRILDKSSTTRGFDVEKLHADAKLGIPALIMTRTYPKIMGWEQSVEGRPHYTKSGRIEMYRDEPEFIEHGENLPVHREPVDATPYEPNVIVTGAPDLIRPAQPESYGLRRDDLSCEARQVRNVVVSPAELTGTSHPGKKLGMTLSYITPKFRHGAHTTPVDVDIISAWFGPFGDMHRRDKRMPWVGEGYVDLNPLDAHDLGIGDGDYVWVDADPEDRPFRGWQDKPADYKVHRAKMRARYYWGLQRGVARSWFHMYVATYGSVEGHEQNSDKLARNPRTGYQAMFRYGSHQSGTRAWLKPTCQTDSLARKEYFGQVMGKGFAADIHCTVGAPKESFVKISKAEDGGTEGVALWKPAKEGYRPGYTKKAMDAYLKGDFIGKEV